MHTRGSAGSNALVYHGAEQLTDLARQSVLGGQRRHTPEDHPADEPLSTAPLSFMMSGITFPHWTIPVAQLTLTRPERER